MPLFSSGVAAAAGAVRPCCCTCLGCTPRRAKFPNNLLSLAGPRWATAVLGSGGGGAGRWDSGGTRASRRRSGGGPQRRHERLVRRQRGGLHGGHERPVPAARGLRGGAAEAAAEISRRISATEADSASPLCSSSAGGTDSRTSVRYSTRGARGRPHPLARFFVPNFTVPNIGRTTPG